MNSRTLGRGKEKGGESRSSQRFSSLENVTAQLDDDGKATKMPKPRRNKPSPTQAMSHALQRSIDQASRRLNDEALKQKSSLSPQYRVPGAQNQCDSKNDRIFQTPSQKHNTFRGMPEGAAEQSRRSQQTADLDPQNLMPGRRLADEQIQEEPAKQRDTFNWQEEKFSQALQHRSRSREQAGVPKVKNESMQLKQSSCE